MFTLLKNSAKPLQFSVKFHQQNNKSEETMKPAQLLAMLFIKGCVRGPHVLPMSS